MNVVERNKMLIESLEMEIAVLVKKRRDALKPIESQLATTREILQSINERQARDNHND